MGDVVKGEDLRARARPARTGRGAFGQGCKEVRF